MTTHGDFTPRDWKDGLCELLCGEGKAEVVGYVKGMLG